jgi:hypothetical protein
MKKFTLALALASLPLAYLGSGVVRRWLASDETEIRWLVADMEEAYNAGDPSGCVEPIAAGWHHAGNELDRRMLFGALLQIAQERERETRELRSRVEIDEEAATITLAGERATLVLDAQFQRRKGAEWQPSWQVRITAELVDGDDGWEIVASSHEDLAGTHLGRE